MKHYLLLALLSLLTSSTFGQISIAPSKQISNYSTFPIDTTAIDLDLDGDLDVITREEYFSWVRWYLNDGDGNFPETLEWAPPIDASLERWQTLGYMDYDGDGNLDILGLLKLIGETSQSICLVRGLEGASFENRFTKILVHEFDPSMFQEELDPLSIPLQDFDGDGRKDIIFENHIVFLGDAALTVTPTSIDLSDFNGWEREQPFADWNGDGMPDLIGISSSSGLTVRLNEGHGNFSEKENIEVAGLGPGPFREMEMNPIKRIGDESSLELCLSYESDQIDYFAVITKETTGATLSGKIAQHDLLPQDIAGA